MDPGATGALSTYQLPVFNRTWCIVYRVVSTNYWYWYGINTSSAGQCVVMSNGTIRVRSGDGTQFLPTFSAPAVGVVVVLTFQLSQDNADVVYRVITGSQTAVTETRYAHTHNNNNTQARPKATHKAQCVSRSPYDRAGDTSGVRKLLQCSILGELGMMRKRSKGQHNEGKMEAKVSKEEKG